MQLLHNPRFTQLGFWTPNSHLGRDIVDYDNFPLARCHSVFIVNVNESKTKLFQGSVDENTQQYIIPDFCIIQFTLKAYFFEIHFPVTLGQLNQVLSLQSFSSEKLSLGGLPRCTVVKRYKPTSSFSKSYTISGTFPYTLIYKNVQFAVYGTTEFSSLSENQVFLSRNKTLHVSWVVVRMKRR